MLWALALGGALLGGLSTWQQGKKEKESLERQKESARQQYELGKNYSDSMYSLQKSEALGQLGIQRRNLDTQLGTAMDDYNTSLLSQAFGIQDARIQNEAGIGASYAQEAAGGTRGDAANEMIRAYAAAGLEKNIDLQNRQNTNYLNQMITGANQTVEAINREAGSWSEGGYRYQQKAAQDAYNKNIFDLGQSDYDWAVQQSQPGFLDYFTGALTGASSGLSMGFSYESYKKLNRNAWDNVGNGSKK